MRFKQFLKAWWSDWLTRMSGPLTVPFAVAALYVSSQFFRAVYVALAILCAGYTSYRLWLTERVAFETELNKNQLPRITVELERAYVSPVVIRGANVFVLASVHNLNAAVSCTVKRYELTICITGRDYFGKQLPVTEFEMNIGQPHMLISDSTGLHDGSLSDLSDATDSTPLTRGIPVHGWLRYGFDDLPPWPTIVGGAGESSRFDTSVVLSATLTAVDAFDQRSSTRKTPPWRNVGTISRIPAEVSIGELAEAIIEFSRRLKEEQRLPHVALSEDELAGHFNETRARISQALVVLQQQGRSKETSLGEHWSFDPKPKN